MFTINLKRLNRAKQQKVLISHFPKSKDASYFLIIGNPETNDILAIKRVSFNRFTSKNVTIALPQNFMTQKLELHLMCDSYIGLDQYHQVDLSLVNKYLQSKGAKLPTVKGLEAFKSYTVVKSQVIKDASDDADDSEIYEKLTEGTQKAVIDEELEALQKQHLEAYGEEDDEENDQMIEKDLDNWI